MRQLLIGIMMLVSFQMYAQERKWTLSECLQYAAENNITVQSTDLDISTAEANYQQSKYNKLPSVTGSASLNAVNGSSIDAITSNFVNQFVFTNNYGVNSTLTLYQGNSLNLQIEQNELLLRQSKLYKEEAKNNIQLSVIEGYLQALYYKEAIVIAKNAVASSTEELQQAQIKYDNGALALLDLKDIETQNATNQYNVVAAENAYAQQVLVLKQLLELEPDVAFDVENITLDENEEAIPNKELVFQRAADYLPTLKTYVLQDSILDKSVDIAKSGFKPTLSLVGGLNTGYTNTLSNSYFTQMRGNFSQSVGLSLSIPIFSKNQNKTNVTLAKIEVEKNQLDKISATKTLYANIENAWQNAVSNQAQQQSSKVAKENAKLAYELARKKYEYGGLTMTELSVSRNNYLTAEQSYLQAKYLTSLYSSLLDFYQGNTINI